jgi:hypothetical protein
VTFSTDSLAVFIFDMNRKSLVVSMVYLIVLVGQSFSTDTPYYNFGIRAGFNISSFESQSENININPAISICTDGYYSDIFYLNFTISYIVRSGSLDDLVVLTPPYEPSTPIYKWDYKFTISYLQFGIRIGFYLFKNFSILGGAGVSIAGYNVSEVKRKGEFQFYFDPTSRDQSRYKEVYSEGPEEPMGEFTFNIGIRYDYEKFFFEVIYMRDIFEKDGFYSIDRINSYLSSMFFSIGYNFIYHIKK